jgi:hypothetical protein
MEIQWYIQSQISFTKKINIFLDVMPCSVVRLLPSSWQKSLLLPWTWRQYITLKLSQDYHTTQCQIPEYSNLHCHHLKDLKSCKPNNQNMQHLMDTLTWGIIAEAVRKHIRMRKLSLTCFHSYINVRAHSNLRYFKMFEFCSSVKTEKLLTLSLQTLCIISTRTQPYAMKPSFSSEKGYKMQHHPTQYTCTISNTNEYWIYKYTIPSQSTYLLLFLNNSP